MKKGLLLFLIFVAGVAARAQSSTSTNALVNIVPAVGAITVLNENLLQDDGLALQTGLMPAFFSNTGGKERASFQLSVVSNAAVYTISLLSPTLPLNFVMQKPAVNAPSISIKKSASKAVLNVYTIAAENHVSFFSTEPTTTIAEEVVVHFN